MVVVFLASIYDLKERGKEPRRKVQVVVGALELAGAPLRIG